MGTCWPRKWKDEVRAMTSRSLICASEVISSSDSPSEKYPWSFFSLRSMKGSTAMDFSLMGRLT